MLNRIFILMVLLLLFIGFQNTLAIFKINKVSCTVHNKAYINISRCQLKAVKRDVAEFSFRGILLNPPVRQCHVHIELLRKYTIYRPFFINVTVDGCEFLRNPKKYPVPFIVYNSFAKYSNLNHTCPYEGEIIIDRYAPSEHVKFFPLPTSEYLIKTDWILNGYNQMSAFFWFVYEEQKKS